MLLAFEGLHHVLEFLLVLLPLDGLPSLQDMLLLEFALLDVETVVGLGYCEGQSILVVL